MWSGWFQLCVLGFRLHHCSLFGVVLILEAETRHWSIFSHKNNFPDPDALTSPHTFTSLNFRKEKERSSEGHQKTKCEQQQMKSRGSKKPEHNIPPSPTSLPRSPKTDFFSTRPPVGFSVCYFNFVTGLLRVGTVTEITDDKTDSAVPKWAYLPVILGWGSWRILGKCLDTYMISRPTLSNSHWWKFVYTKCRHDVIMSEHPKI